MEYGRKKQKVEEIESNDFTLNSLDIYKDPPKGTITVEDFLNYGKKRMEGTIRHWI